MSFMHTIRKETWRWLVIICKLYTQYQYFPDNYVWNWRDCWLTWRICLITAFLLIPPWLEKMLKLWGMKSLRLQWNYMNNLCLATLFLLNTPWLAKFKKMLTLKYLKMQWNLVNKLFGHVSSNSTMVGRHFWKCWTWNP